MTAAGNTVDLAGRNWTMSPLNIVGLKALGARINHLGEGLTPEALDALVVATYHSIRRVHPEITLELVEEHVDVLNMPGVLAVLSRVNQFETGTSQGEGSPAQ